MDNPTNLLDQFFVDEAGVFLEKADGVFRITVVRGLYSEHEELDVKFREYITYREAKDIFDLAIGCMVGKAYIAKGTVC